MGGRRAVGGRSGAWWVARATPRRPSPETTSPYPFHLLLALTSAATRASRVGSLPWTATRDARCRGSRRVGEGWAVVGALSAGQPAVGRWAGGLPAPRTSHPPRRTRSPCPPARFWQTQRQYLRWGRGSGRNVGRAASPLARPPARVPPPPPARPSSQPTPHPAPPAIHRHAPPRRSNRGSTRAVASQNSAVRNGPAARRLNAWVRLGSRSLASPMAVGGGWARPPARTAVYTHLLGCGQVPEPRRPPHHRARRALPGATAARAPSLSAHPPSSSRRPGAGGPMPSSPRKRRAPPDGGATNAFVARTEVGI